MTAKNQKQGQRVAADSVADADADASTADEAFDDVGSAESSAADDSDAEASRSDELAVERDRSLRLRAELENLRSRTAREIAEERRYAALPLVRDLLPVLDNIDRAIEAAEKRGDASDLLEGFRMVRQQLATVLTMHQCVPIEAESTAFDPQLHEAILQQPSTECPANHVLMVTQTGYQLHDRIVRPAQVIVSAGSPSGETE